MDNGEDFTEIGFTEEAEVESKIDVVSSISTCSKGLPESSNPLQMADEEKEIRKDTAKLVQSWCLKQKVKDLWNIYKTSYLWRWIAIFVLMLALIFSCYVFLKFTYSGIQISQRINDLTQKLLWKDRNLKQYRVQTDLPIDEIFKQIEDSLLKLKDGIQKVNRVMMQHGLKESVDQFLKEIEVFIEELEAESCSLKCLIMYNLQSAKMNVVTRFDECNLPVVKFNSAVGQKPKAENEGFIEQLRNRFIRIKNSFSEIFQKCIESCKAAVKLSSGLFSTCQECVRSWKKKLEIFVAVLFFIVLCVNFIGNINSLRQEYIEAIKGKIVFFYSLMSIVYFTLVVFQYA